MDESATAYMSHIYHAPGIPGQFSMHMLPCSIQHNGPAPVSQFFRPSAQAVPGDAEAAEAKVEEAAFRGRKLLGATVPLSPGFKGFVLETLPDEHDKSGTPRGTGDTAVMHEGWRVQSTFSEIRYWEHGRAPSITDPLQRCLAWLKLSEQIHSPITELEVDAMASKHKFLDGALMDPK